MNRLLPILALALLFAALLGFDAVAGPPNSVTSTRENLGSLQSTTGFCVEASATLTEVWANHVPANITTAELGEVRWIEIMHADSAQDGDAVCASFGDDLGTDLNCDPTGDPTDTAAPLFKFGQARTYHVRRTPQRGGTTGALPELWIRSASGTGDVTTCITLGS